MHKLQSVLSISFVLTVIVLISSCGKSIQVPEWFSSPPEDSNYLYATATTTSRDIQMAINSAKEGARVEIARQLETKINSMFKRFREEVGAGEDAEFLTQTSDVSKSVTSKVLSGSRAAKTKTTKEGMMFRAYVLVEMPIGAANTALMDAIKKQEQYIPVSGPPKGFRNWKVKWTSTKNTKQNRVLLLNQGDGLGRRDC